MSGASWLKAQRKQELVGLAQQAGLKDYESLKKADLEVALESALRANPDTLSKNDEFAAFYKRAGSAKKDGSVASSTAAMIELKTPGIKKRVSKTKDDIAGAANEASLALARTPSIAKQLLPSTVPLPPSPAMVASHIDRQLTRGKSRLSHAFKSSGISEYTDSIRDNVSSAAAVQSIALFLEFVGVINETLPRKLVFAIPAIGVYIKEYPVRANNMFNLLTTDFWSPFTFWFCVSVGLPLLTSYFFNLGLKSKSNSRHNTRSSAHSTAQFDPLAFNLAKAALQWMVFSQAATVYGYPSVENKARIENALPFGYQGVMVTAGLGVVLSLYEAILRK